MIGICLSSVSVVPAGAAAWNPSSPPLKFRTARFPVPLRARDNSEKRFQETVPPRHSTSTQRLFRSVRLSDLDNNLAGLIQFAQGAVRSAFVDIAQRRVVEEHRFIFVGLITSSRRI